MEKITAILKNFSFSEPESLLYIAALKLKKATVSHIAQKAGMGRTVTYFHIKNLTKRGIFKQTKQGRVLIFTPTPPAELARILQESVGNFKSFVPELESLNVVESELPEIRIEESKEAFRRIYDEVIHMPAGSTWKVIEDKRGAQGEMKLIDNAYWGHFFGEMRQRKILTKAIFTEELLLDINKSITPENYAVLKQRRWNIRTIPEKALPIQNFVVLYNKKLSFMFPEISMTLTIRHPLLYHIFDTMFETIFSFCKPVDNPWDSMRPQKATEEDIYY